MFYQASNVPHFFCLVSFGFEEAEKEVLDFAMCYQASNLPHFSTLLPLASFFFCWGSGEGSVRFCHVLLTFPQNLSISSAKLPPPPDKCHTMMLFSLSISSAKLPFVRVFIKPHVSTFCEMVSSYAIFSHCIILPFPRATVIDLMRNIPNRGVGLLVYNSKFALSYRARAWAVMRSITVKGLFFFFLHSACQSYRI